METLGIPFTVKSPMVMEFDLKGISLEAVNSLAIDAIVELARRTRKKPIDILASLTATMPEGL